MLGFLNLHKPAQMTSHDCVGRVRRICGLKRVGHGGTLDPLAIGVLPIALGPATRLLPYLPIQKAYQATIRFGITTTTDDLAGDMLSSQMADHLTQAEVEQQLPQFVGWLDQHPPAYSAVQVQGQRLYTLARQGKAVTAPLRTVQVFDIQPLAWRGGEQPELEVAIACGPGTYIRSIARDLGGVLGTGATLAHLTRTLSCGFDLADSMTFDTLEAQVQAGTFRPIEPSFSLQQPILDLPPAEAQRFCWGQQLPQDLPEGIMQVHDTYHHFLGMGEIIDGVLKPKVVLPSTS